MKNICKDPKSTQKETKLTIQNLRGAFFILAFGFGLASVAFFLEVTHHLLQQQKVGNQN